MKIVVCVKYVPDAQSERSFSSDNTTERASVDGLLSELDEYAVEEALSLAEDHDGQVIAVTMGPDEAGAAVKKSLQMGAHAGVHINDDAIAGSDSPATSLILAKAIEKIGEDEAVDLVIAGLASTDGVMSVVPAMLAERLGLPQVTFASELGIAEGTVTIKRDGDVASETIEAALPALVSVTDQINDPRYPSFKGIMAAKKKPVDVWSLTDIGVDPADVGLAAAWTTVVTITQRPPRSQGEIVTDDGSGGQALADFLTTRKFA
ncbi:MAG: electron transfer flavoprotein subunit beta/FixA family protein [Ornithinimicrobium sp.]